MRPNHLKGKLKADQPALGCSVMFPSPQNMLLWTTTGFGYTAANCMSWMDEAGFHDTRVGSLVAGQSMIIGVK